MKTEGEQPAQLVDIKNIPDKIYLQIDADGETPDDFRELQGVSWCSERINNNDIEYSRVSPSPERGERTYTKEEVIESCRAALENAAKNVQVIYEAQEFKEVDLLSIQDERNIPKI